MKIKEFFKEFLILVFAFVIFLLSLGYGLKCIGQYFNHHPIKLFHPFPSLTRKIPFFRRIDKFLMLTAGIKWYKVKEITTGDDYIVYFGYDEKRFVDRIMIMNYKKRDKWEYISRNTFLSKFDDGNMKELIVIFKD